MRARGTHQSRDRSRLSLRSRGLDPSRGTLARRRSSLGGERGNLIRRSVNLVLFYPKREPLSSLLNSRIRRSFGGDTALTRSLFSRRDRSSLHHPVEPAS
jgi:hypothetical protein